MQGQSHAWQNLGEPLNSPDADSQEAIRAPNGRKRTVGRFEHATLMWSFEAHIETLKDQLSRVEARAERQAAEFAERAAQVAAEHTARIKALEGHIETLKAREGPTERVESQAAELAALIHTLKDQLSIGEARAERQAAEFAERAAQVAAEHTAQIKTLEGHIETLKAQLSAAETQLAERATDEARAERQAAEFAERAAQVAAEHTAQIKTLEGHIETLKAQLSAAETQLAERATEHEANIAAERVKSEAERVKTEAEQAKAARAIARYKELAAELELEKERELTNRPWWKRIWRIVGHPAPKDVGKPFALPIDPIVAGRLELEISERSAKRAQWQLPSMTFDRAYRPGDKGAFRSLGRCP